MPERFAQIDEIFRAALRVEDDGRREFIARRCSGDPSMCEEVLALLAEDQATVGKGPLDRPALGAGASLSTMIGAPLGNRSSLPETIGRYRIVRTLGTGGMGVVYEAEQDHPRRTVALKIINAGLATPEMLRRFEHEAEVLGRLQHAGIAQIFEAGTFESSAGVLQPFFAMEFINGEPLMAYSAHHKPSTRERMMLLARICDAVQHAHQRGVIHRDLKPSNILVLESTDGITSVGPEPKILDFGVARATNADVHAATLQTDIGQLIGTIPYMSPEQAAGDPRELDTRSDVYALGVVAYELLTGQLPYDIRDKFVHEAVRVIQEVDPTSMRTCDRGLSGDIETVVSKALEKDKSRRYQSASEFADDIRRCLNDEPVLARPPSVLYQVRKFAKRNTMTVTAAGLVLAVLIAGIIGVSAALARAVKAEGRAIGERDRALAINNFLTKDLLAQAAPEFNAVNSDVTVRQLLDRAATRIAEGYEGPPEVEAAVTGVLGETYFALGLFDPAELHARRELEIVDRLHGQHHPMTLRAMAGVARALVAQSRLQEAETMYIELMDIAPAVLEPEDPELLGYRNNYAECIVARGRLDEGASLHERNLAVRERLFGVDDDNTLETMNNLAAVYYMQRRLPEAEALFRKTADGRARMLGEDHPRTLLSLGNLGVALRAQGKLAETEPIYRRVYELDSRVMGPEHPDTLTDMHNLAALLAAQERDSEAEDLYRRVIDLRRKVLGPQHPVVAYSLAGLGTMLCGDGRPAEGEPYLREALDIRQASLAPGHRLIHASTADLASCLTQQQEYEQAERVLANTLQTAEAAGTGPAAAHALASSYVELYETWGRDDNAHAWRVKMNEPPKENRD